MRSEASSFLVRTAALANAQGYRPTRIPNTIMRTASHKLDGLSRARGRSEGAAEG